MHVHENANPYQLDLPVHYSVAEFTGYFEIITGVFPVAEFIRALAACNLYHVCDCDEHASDTLGCYYPSGQLPSGQWGQDNTGLSLPSPARRSNSSLILPLRYAYWYHKICGSCDQAIKGLI